jgi:hypothetical protein
VALPESLLKFSPKVRDEGDEELRGLKAEILLSELLMELESRGAHPDLVEYVGLRCLAEYAPEKLDGLSVQVDKSGNRFRALSFEGDDLLITPELAATDGNA